MVRGKGVGVRVRVRVKVRVRVRVRVAVGDGYGGPKVSFPGTMHYSTPTPVVGHSDASRRALPCLMGAGYFHAAIP